MSDANPSTATTAAATAPPPPASQQAVATRAPKLPPAVPKLMRQRPRQEAPPPPPPPSPPPSPTTTKREGDTEEDLRHSHRDRRTVDGGPKKTRAPKGPEKKIWKPEQRCFEFLRDLAHPSQLGRSCTSEQLARRSTSVQAAVNRALHQEGASVRTQDFFLTRGGKYRGSTSPTSCASQLLEFRAVAIRAARSADPAVTDLEARESWWWAKAHAIPVARYLGRGSNGTETLRKKLEAENEGIRIPSTIR